jgi:hypothetical protein
MRLRFTVRDLLWLAVVVALATAWWLDHRQAAAYKTKVEWVWSRLDIWPGVSGPTPSIDQLYKTIEKVESAGRAASK